MTLLFLVLAISSATPAADESVVPVERDPRHKTVFLNQHVQAFRVQLAPGQATRMHRHVRDDAAVRLTTATSTSQSLGEPVGDAQSAPLGFVSARDNESRPTTHRVRNVGDTPFDVIDVQILARPPGPAEPAVAAPAAENPKMRVYRYELAPGETTAMHTHARPYLLVAATAADLLVGSPDGKSTAHAVEPGELQWVDAAVTHAFTNRGSAPGILVEFELR